MSLNILLAETTTATAQQGFSLTSILPLVAMIAVFGLAMYFLVYRPQKKQEREANELRNNLAIGDEVTTIGGIIGRVVSIKDETFVLETTKERTKIRFLRSALKSIDVKVADTTGVQKTEATDKSDEPEKIEAPKTDAPAQEVENQEQTEVVLNGKKQKKK